MAVISFAKKPSAPEPTTAVAVVPKQEVQVASTFSSPQIEGEFTRRDVAVPYLSIGQKSGKLCDEHPEWIGTFVWDKSVCLGKEFNGVFCRLAKRYEEDLEYGSEEIPQRFDTIAEAKAAGVNVKDVADLDLLIETSNAELAEFAVIEIDGKNYLPARFTARSSSYGATVKFILKDLGGWLKGDLSGGFYTISTEKRTNGTNSWFVPKLKTAGKVGSELRAAIAERFAS